MDTQDVKPTHLDAEAIFSASSGRSRMEQYGD